MAFFHHSKAQKRKLKQIKFSFGFLFFLPFFGFFIFSSCQGFKNSKPILKLGKQEWTLQEVQAYMELRLSHSNLQKNPDKLKDLFLKEILFQALLEDWAKEKKVNIQKKAWNRQSFVLFFTDPLKLKALKKHQKFILLKSALLEALKNQIPEPDLKVQKEFYEKNKALFKEPAQCQLKQILVENEKLALSLYNRAKEGEAFSVLATNHSLKKDPGWVKKGQLEVFDQACFIDQDSLTSPLKSSYGYHVFLKTGSKPSQQKSFTESKKKILAHLKEKEMAFVFQNWLKKESLKKSFWMDKKSLDQIKIQYKRGMK